MAYYIAMFTSLNGKEKSNLVFFSAFFYSSCFLVFATTVVYVAGFYCALYSTTIGGETETKFA